MDAAIAVHDVTKTFGDHRAVDGISFDVPRGRVFGLLGPNGAGKTTTIRLLMGILLPDTGTVDLGGVSRRKIGYLPEERGLYPRMNVEEQLVFLGVLKGLARAEARRRVGPWLERLGLGTWGTKKVQELSKGMQQKLQLAAALLHDPEVIIVDEPMSGLDPLGMDVVREVLLERCAEGKTVVLSSHQMDMVERLCDRVVLIDKGRKVLDGTVAEAKGRYGTNRIVLVFTGDGAFLGGVPGVQGVKASGEFAELQLAPGADTQGILRAVASRVTVRKFEVAEPSLHDVFVDLVRSAA